MPITDDLTTLGLRGSGRAPRATVPPLLDEVLSRFVLAALPKPMDESGADGNGQQGDLQAEFELAWAALREAATGQDVAACSEALLALCDRAVEACQQERVSNRAEVASLVTLVRDAARAIAGEGQTFSTDINASIERFDALRHVPDLRELKARLSAEVVELKAFASERESRWKSMEGQFEQRIEQLTQQLTDTRREATTDPLTGAANRRLFEEAFEAMMASGERDIVVAMFDVDNFKRINDTLGHAAGDAVLVAVADAIRTVVRANDVMSRLGGDEFAVLMGGHHAPTGRAPPAVDHEHRGRHDGRTRQRNTRDHQLRRVRVVGGGHA